MTLSDLKLLADQMAKKLWGKRAAGAVLHILTSDRPWQLIGSRRGKSWEALGLFKTKYHLAMYLRGMLEALERKGR